MNEVILIISYFVTLIVMFVVYKNIIRKKIMINKWWLILSLFVAGFVDFLLHKYTFPAYGAIFNCVFFLGLIKITFDMKFKDTIFYGIIVWVSSSFLDMLLMNIVKAVNNNFDLMNDSTLKITATILLISILLLISKNKRLHKYIEKFKKVLIKKNFSYLKFVFFVILYVLLDGLCFYNIDRNNIGRFILLVSFSLIFTILMYLYLKYKISILKETNDLLIKNNDYILNLITEYRILKHNLTNQLLGLKTTANVKTKGLIDDIIKEYNESYETSCDITKIPSGLNGIVYEKLALYKDDKLNVFSLNKIEENLLEKVSLRSYNLLCEAIGVALDNAMEASKESKEKIVYLYFNETEEEVKIKIENSYTGTIDLEEIGTINYTSKSKGHGLGLFSLIEKKKINIQNRIKNNFFATYITIEKEKQ